jgi:ABC-type lipoprotein export system ATPase subunit
MGPSGAGKSTLLHVLGMHDAAWTGEYFLADQPVHALDRKKRMDLQKKMIGFVFQSYHLLDDLTVYESGGYQSLAEVQDVTATSDTTFEILVPPPSIP